MRESHGMMVFDTLAELIDPQWTAIIAVDIQNDFCHPDGHFALHGKDVTAIMRALPAMRRLVVEGRRLGLPIFLIQQGTLPGGASDSPAWRRFKTRDGKSPFYTLVGSWGWLVDEKLEPAAEDMRIDKFRPDAFVATDLDLLLRARHPERRHSWHRH
jgi:ureidoacrylate peracid hydrolase